ncbi:MAG: oxidoreductase [Bacteroidia bacterium]|nr:oxidoreductase [Bacteroidia bacterium]
MLLNRIIIVTGGAGLLGRSFCEEIIINHGICIIADLNAEAGEQTQKELQAKYANAQVHFIHLNINSKESIIELIEKLHIKFGKIDAVVNNAYPRNKNYGRHYFDVEYADFCENININLGGYFLVGQQFAAYFLKQGFGNIINISSIYGIIAPRFDIYDDTKMTMPVEYAVIKSGLLHLTKYMAKYFKGKNIRVNAISLGGIKDAQPKSFLIKYRKLCLNKGMLNPQDINGTLIFLLSIHSMAINGQNIVVDDGYTL